MHDAMRMVSTHSLPYFWLTFAIARGSCINPFTSSVTLSFWCSRGVVPSLERRLTETCMLAIPSRRPMNSDPFYGTACDQCLLILTHRRMMFYLVRYQTGDHAKNTWLHEADAVTDHVPLLIFRPVSPLLCTYTFYAFVLKPRSVLLPCPAFCQR